jgi:capsular polysaccharide biosynthesis protein
LSLLRVLARRWLHIAVAVAVCGLGGLIAGVATPATYESSARVFLDLSGSTQSSVDPTAIVQTDADLATSTQALEIIGANVKVSGAPVGTGYAASHVSALPAPSGYYFVITATAGTQANANLLVAAAEAAFSNVLADGGGGSDGPVNALKKKISDLTTQLNNTDQKSDPATYNELSNVLPQLQQKLTDTEVAQAAAAATVKLAETPVEAGKVSPKPFTNMLIGGLVGLLLAVAVIWIRYLRQPIVLDGRAAADAIGAPLIVGGSAKITPSIDTIVSGIAAVLSPTAKVVALTAAGAGDLTADTVAGLAASWSDDQGFVLVLDASPASEVRAVLERLPRPTSAGLPSWAHEQTCLARSSGSGRGHVLYNRVSPSRASRPAGSRRSWRTGPATSTWCCC